MKYYILILFVLFSIGVKAQYPSQQTPTQFSTGWFKQGWPQADSGHILAVRPPNFTPRFAGTTILYQNNGVDTSIHYWTGGRWIKINPTGTDTTSLSNRINLKLNITDTANKWWGIGKRWVDTVYRKNDSTIGYTINGGAEQTFQILGRSSSGPGSGLTSVGLSMPSAFSVSGSPLTNNGTINVFGAGTTAQYVRGNGTLATTDTGMIPNFYLKVRSLLSGTSPITYNSTTGGIGIPDANNTGQKGAATFNNTDFTDNGAGLISLRNPAAFPGVDTIWRTPGIDSIYFKINGVQGAILDSAGATVTANNGLTKTSNNIQLGGALIQATNITSAAGANRIIYSGVSASGDGAQLDVSTSGSVGIAVKGASTDGRGLFGTATNGVGMYGSATGSGGIGVFSTTTDGSSIYSTTNAAGLLFEGVSIPTSTNTVIPVMALTRSSQSAGGNGIGGSVDMYLHTTLADQQTNRIIYKLTNATDASYTSSMEFWNANSATVARKASLAGSGQWTWDGYPALTAQADTTANKPLAIDGSGNVIKMTGWASTSSVNWCNVINNGADTTGTIDASPYVQNLINSGCRYIYLPRGTYLFSNTVQMKDSVTIKGDGRQNTIVKLNSDIPAFKLGDALGGYKAQFLDIGFKGTDSTSGSGNQTGILLDSVNGVYISNVGGYLLGGWVVRMKRNGYCCGTYTTTATRGNIVSNCYAQKCFGGFYLDTLAEYNTVDNTTAVNGLYGVFVAGGNSRVNNSNLSSNTYGLYLTGGSNNGHGVAVGNTINHNSYNIYATGVSLGYTFSANASYAAGTQEVYIDNSDNVNFYGGAIMAGRVTSVNNTNCTFSNVRMSAPVWTITGTAPTVITNGEALNTISVKDVVNSKQLDFSQVNGVATFAGSGTTKFRISDSLVLYGRRFLFGGETSSDSLILSSTTAGTKGKIWFGNSTNRTTVSGSLGTQYREVSDTWGIGVPIGSNPATDFHVQRNYSGVCDIRSEQMNAGTGSGARFTAKNDGGELLQLLMSSTTNVFFAHGATVQSTGTGGLALAANAGPIYFSKSSTISTASNILATLSTTTGNFGVGAGLTAPLDKLHVLGTARITDTLKLPNIILQSDTNNYKPVVIDATGNVFKMTGWPATGSSATTIYSGDGTLAGPRLVSTGGNTLTVSGANNSDTVMIINNTGTSGLGLQVNGSALGINVISSGGTGIQSFGSTKGAIITGDTDEGLLAKSNAVRGARIQTVPSSTNTVVEVMQLERGSSGGAGATGIGEYVSFLNKTSSNSSDISNTLISKFTDGTTATRTSQFVITGVNSASTTNVLTLDGDGTMTTIGKRILGLVTSSAGTLTIGNAEAYIFNGTTTTWTLPAVSGTTGYIYYIKNIGSGSITLNSNAGGNDIYTSSAVSTTTVTAGSSIILISSGTYFTVN